MESYGASINGVITPISGVIYRPTYNWFSGAHLVLRMGILYDGMCVCNPRKPGLPRSTTGVTPQPEAEKFGSNQVLFEKEKKTRIPEEEKKSSMQSLKQEILEYLGSSENAKLHSGS